MSDSTKSDRFFDVLSKLSTAWDWTPQWVRGWGVTLLTMLWAAWLAGRERVSLWEMLLIAVWAGAGTAILIYYVSQTLRVGPRITRKSLQSVVRDWSDKAAVSVERLEANEWIWGYKLTQPGNIKVAVVQRKDPDNYIALGGSIRLTGTVGTRFAAMTRTEQLETLAVIKVELARLNLIWGGFSLPVSNLAVERNLPITRELSEHQFVDAVREIQNAVLLMGQLLSLRTGAYADAVEPPPTPPPVLPANAGETTTNG